MGDDLSGKQVGYYAETAESYDRTHIREDDEHEVAADLMIALLRGRRLRRILDVGCGTGRVTKRLLDEGFDVIGIDPAAALLEKAREKGMPADRLIHGSGDKLPFPDGSFDAVCEFGVLHHVATPGVVVSEMLRVSSKAIFLSDTNRFGRSHLAARLVKLILWKTGLWRAAYFIAKGGKLYDCSECDGIAYSYSVYDSFDQIDRWAEQTVCIPTKVEGRRLRSWAHPLLTASHVLLCGLRSDAPGLKAE